MEKTQRIINEFIQEGNLKEFEVEVELIIRKIIEENCRISPHYIDQKSSFNNGPPAHIRIELKGRNVPIQIIWDILHEYGHFLSERAERQDPDMGREILAWNNARNELNHYPKLLSLLPDFEAYREVCLQTYHKN